MLYMYYVICRLPLSMVTTEIGNCSQSEFVLMVLSSRLTLSIVVKLVFPYVHSLAHAASEVVMGSRRTEWIRQGLVAIADDLDMHMHTASRSEALNAEIAESIRWRMEMMLRDMFALDLYGELNNTEVQSLGLFSQAYQHISAFARNLSAAEEPAITSRFSEQPPMIIDGAIGRPKFDISYVQLKEMIEHRFSVRNIADLLGVSVSTIRRRMTMFGLTVRDTYSNISDAELDYIISGAQQQYPNWGNRLMYGHLISIGIRVQFNRVRESQSRIDPEGSFLRRLQILNRRKYSVPGPQWLWHIDGYHKLIR